MQRRNLFTLAVVLIMAGVANPCCGQASSSPSEPRPERVVIPFDFESRFDDGRYGQMIGDMIWKKLDRDGGFVIPESMLDVRAWSQRNKTVPNHETSLAAMKGIVDGQFGGQIGIWGKVERVAGFQTDIYDLWILVADFSADPPRMIYQTKTRTRTVSEIPHVYVKAALDELYGRKPETPQPPDLDRERLWQEAPNLVQGDFQQGTPHPRGWDPLPPHVSRLSESTADASDNRFLRFSLNKDVAATTGVLYYSDYFPIEAGATYRFQCRYRTTGSAPKVFIKCYHDFPRTAAQASAESASTDRREVYRSQQNLKGTSGTWNVHTEDFTPKHSQYRPTCGRIMLCAYWPAGTVDWDDIVLKQISPP
jgi:hypothetical protein